MTTNKKAAPAASPGTASNTAFNSAKSSTQQDPVKGWYGLGENARKRQQKPTKPPRRQRGYLDSDFNDERPVDLDESLSMRFGNHLFIIRNKTHEMIRYHEQRAHWFRMSMYCLALGLLRIVAKGVR